MFKIVGKLEELGESEGNAEGCEIAIERVTGERVRITGLTKNEVQQIAHRWGDDVSVTVASS
jgi:hypothetical protein